MKPYLILAVILMSGCTESYQTQQSHFEPFEGLTGELLGIGYF